jgi:hypothetical protein
MGAGLRGCEGWGVAIARNCSKTLLLQITRFDGILD